MENSKTILVVEDNPELNDYIASIFKKEYCVLTAFDGLEGCQIAREKTPNLIITDVLMPFMNGLELTKKLKNDSSTSHIPVIILTSLNTEADVINGLKNSTDIYLTKPFSSTLLKAYAESLLHSRALLNEKYNQLNLLKPKEVVVKAQDEEFLIHLKEIIEKNISNDSFDNQKLTSEFNLSYSTLLRKVKSLTGITIHDIIKKMRLKRAAYLLKTSNLSITEISDKCGYSEPAYFSRCFTNEYGIPPSQYVVKKY